MIISITLIIHSFVVPRRCLRLCWPKVEVTGLLPQVGVVGVRWSYRMAYWIGTVNGHLCA